MMAQSETAVPRGATAAPRLRLPQAGPRVAAWLLPTVAAAAMLVVIFLIQPGITNYTGLGLLLSGTFPLVLAALAQMFVIAAGDVDLSVGSFVGLVNVVVAVILGPHAALGVLFLIGLVVAQVALGTLITLRRLPSIIVTLGASFIWLGLAIVILPTPGGTVPQSIVSAVNVAPPVIPGVILGLIVVTALTSFGLMGTRYGAVLRSAGSNPEGTARTGWSVLKARMALYAASGVLGVLSGLVLSGQAVSGDASISQSYVLLTIAAVIVGGASFSGGDVSPGGTVAGALLMGLIASLLQFLNVSADYQVGAQGLVLIAILTARAGFSYARRAAA
jgi:ribose/xylose/arabinose/galactoside ABC-type transport system permease subunit